MKIPLGITGKAPAAGACRRARGPGQRRRRSPRSSGTAAFFSLLFYPECSSLVFLTRGASRFVRPAPAATDVLTKVFDADGNYTGAIALNGACGRAAFF